MQNPLQNKGKFERGFSQNHFGVDWSSFENLIIFPAESGTVDYINNNCPEVGFYGSSCGDGGGNWLQINHSNGLKTRYLHFSKIFIKLGQKVYRNTPLGIIGTSGSSTGKHLHFEVIRNGIKVNPIPYLNDSNKANNWLLILALLFVFNEEIGIEI
jgi:murein DD-endopeptidase MepM/ murein hydrolase activator NlpD